MTRTDEFNKSLEIQQSTYTRLYISFRRLTVLNCIDLLAQYEVNNQITAIEDLISQGADMQTVLRLLCLATVVTGGIKAKSLENIKRDILQAYGYNYLPLLLSLSSPPLSILLPTPLPPSAPPSVAASKYPFSSLRKSLRLLIEDPDPLEELENDISYVYSGYAPISVRLVQCVAQKGGLLSNPAGDEKKRGVDSADAAKGKGVQVQAHPIVGWKGFEDLVASIPGETVDIVQRVPGGENTLTAVAALRECVSYAMGCRLFLM